MTADRWALGSWVSPPSSCWESQGSALLAFWSLPETTGTTTYKELGHEGSPGNPLGTGQRGLSSGLAQLPAHLWPGPDLVSYPRGHTLGKDPREQLRASSPACALWSPGGVWAYSGAQPDLRTSVRTCPLCPAPTSQTKPSGPAHWRSGAVSATSPAPGDGPEWWLGATGAASPEGG